MRNRWAIFLSGRGSTAQAMMDLADLADVAVVYSSSKHAAGAVRARRMGIPVVQLSSPIQWEDVQLDLVRRSIRRIFLLGFMKIVPADFVKKWTGRIWNIHPSLLPKFPGLKALEKSFEAKTEMGCTVHEVTEGMDEGPRVIQRRLGIQADLKIAKTRMGFAEQALVRRMGFSGMGAISGL